MFVFFGPQLEVGPQLSSEIPELEIPKLEIPEPELESFQSFDQKLHAVVITIQNLPAITHEMVVTVHFRALNGSDERSGGILEIKLSEKPKYNIANCIEGDFTLPNISDEELLQLRIVKRYPWIAISCNGVIVVKHNFFSFKNPDCRSVWAIKANNVSINTTSETGPNEASLKTEILNQGKNFTATSQVYK